MHPRAFTVGFFTLLIGVELVALSGTSFALEEIAIVCTSAVAAVILLSVVSRMLESWLRRRIVEKYVLEPSLISVFFVGTIHFGVFLWLMFEILTRTALPLHAAWAIATLTPAFAMILIAAVLGS